MSYSVAIIGTGANPESRDRTGFSMGYRHASGYRRLDSCELVACADIVPESARTFAEHFDLEHWYDDHTELLQEVDPDIVSICVPPDIHADLVIDCAELGNLDAIHCEKPMASTWGDCQEMVDACERQSVQLTINHQRRFALPVQLAKQHLDNGEIGSLKRLEWSEANLFDAGSHLFDLCDYFTDGATPTWALAAVDIDPDNRWFGVVNDAQGIATWGYNDGTVGLAATNETDEPSVVDAYLRIVGESGIIEVEPNDGPSLRIDTGDGWRPIDTGGESVYRPAQSKARMATNMVLDAIPRVSYELSGNPSHYDRAIAHLVASLDAGVEPTISARRVMRGTELIFACYESARSRGRVDLPLTIADNPLDSMIEENESRMVQDIVQ